MALLLILPAGRKRADDTGLSLLIVQMRFAKAVDSFLLI